VNQRKWSWIHCPHWQRSPTSWRDPQSRISYAGILILRDIDRSETGEGQDNTHANDLSTHLDNAATTIVVSIKLGSMKAV
jgi:hypothetical protein